MELHEIKEPKFKLGQEVKDVITGFKGTVTAVAFYYNGCVRYQLQPPLDKDKKMTETVMIDEEQLEAIGKPPKAKIVTPHGGDRPGLPKYKRL